MGRPRQHDDATRLALLDAAERLLERDGVEAASVRAVADAVGTTTRAVYSVLESKHGMLEALAARLFDLLIDAIEACPRTADPVADVVTASLQGFRRTALDHPALYSLVFLRVVPDLRPGPAMAEVASRAFGTLEALLERVAAAGLLGATTPARAAQALHALTEGLATVELRGALGPEAEEVWRSAVTALLAGFAVATRAAAAPPPARGARRRPARP